MAPPEKKQKKLFDDESSDEDNGGGVSLNANEDDAGFKINEEYAKRFEYNKKREELARLEEKHGKALPKKDGGDAPNDEDEESSSSEEEDDDAVLATETLDREIMDTLNAIRNKDPRVYDESVKFYSEVKDEDLPAPQPKEKPMTLRDYHRQNLLRAAKEGKAVGDDEEEEPQEKIKTHAEEQEELKRQVIGEMHAAAEQGDDNESDDGGFLIPKEKPEQPKEDKTTATAERKKKLTEQDIANADKDPELFLSNFMSARAWLPSGESRFKPLESDDDEEFERADKYEEAYNLRFEDPNKINETLTTHARDLTNKFSVRREEPSSRKKKREAERAKAEEERKEREVERARLRKLKIEQLEEKIAKIKKAAGIKTTDDITEEDWVKFLDEDYGDENFEKEMQRRFGEDYYAQQEEELTDGEEDDGKGGKKKKLKKPKWDDDIDIKDLVPDFEEDDDKVELPEGADGEGEDEEMPDADADDDADDDEDDGTSKPKSKKARLKEKKEAQRASRKERRKIEALVDQSLSLEPSLLPGGKKKHTGFFRYRETSPTSFGLTARDILLADDKQLNQFAGLKKLAPFRDEERKKKDRKKLGKKARLREWRKETFGSEEGPADKAFEEALRKGRESDRADKKAQEDGEGENVDIRDGGRKKRKRSRKH